MTNRHRETSNVAKRRQETVTGLIRDLVDLQCRVFRCLKLRRGMDPQKQFPLRDPRGCQLHFRLGPKFQRKTIAETVVQRHFHALQEEIIIRILGMVVVGSRDFQRMLLVQVADNLPEGPILCLQRKRPGLQATFIKRNLRIAM